MRLSPKPRQVLCRHCPSSLILIGTGRWADKYGRTVCIRATASEIAAGIAEYILHHAPMPAPLKGAPRDERPS